MYVKFVDLRRYQKRSKCKVDITFTGTSHLHLNTTRITICFCIIIASNVNLGQIWSHKFASYLLQLQIHLNPIFRPVIVSKRREQVLHVNNSSPKMHNTTKALERMTGKYPALLKPNTKILPMAFHLLF